MDIISRLRDFFIQAKAKLPQAVTIYGNVVKMKDMALFILDRYIENVVGQSHIPTTKAYFDNGLTLRGAVSFLERDLCGKCSVSSREFRTMRRDVAEVLKKALYNDDFCVDVKDFSSYPVSSRVGWEIRFVLSRKVEAVI